MSRDYTNPYYPQGNRYDNYGSPDAGNQNPYSSSYSNQDGGYFNSGHAYTPPSELLDHEHESVHARHARRPNSLLRSDTEVDIDGTSGYAEQPRAARPNSLLRTDTSQGGGYNPQDRPNPLQRSDTDVEIDGGFKRPNLLFRSDTDLENNGFGSPPVRPNPPHLPDSEYEAIQRESSRHQNRAYGEYADRERYVRGATSGAHYEGEDAYGGGRHGGERHSGERHGTGGRHGGGRHGGSAYGEPRRPGYGDDEGQGSYDGGSYGRRY